MGSHDDPGVMGINYRSEPMRERLKYHDDPAYIFSSLVHTLFIRLWGVWHLRHTGAGNSCR